MKLGDWLMEMLNRLVDAIINNSSKSIIISLLALLLIGLNLLGINIEHIINFKYSAFTLNVINLLLTVSLNGFILIKIDELKKLCNTTESELSTVSAIKDTIDLVETQLIKINSEQQTLLLTCRSVADEISNIPNLRSLRKIFELKISSAWYDIFKACLTYILVVNDSSGLIVKNTFNNTVAETRKEIAKFINYYLKNYDVNETLSQKINEKISNVEQLILTELEKDKKVTEKLYIVSVVLNQMQEDLVACIDDYLQMIQINSMKN